jgi:hypothetical protein
MKAILFLVMMAIYISCADKPGKIVQSTGIQEQKVNKVSKPSSSFSDTLAIRVSSAVFFMPDSVQLLKFKAISTPRDFESETHNWFYQMRNARMVVGKYWPGLQVMETSHSRYLLFVKTDNQKVLVDLDKQGDMAGIFLFDGKKSPELADMMNIDSFLGFYFQK